MAILKLPVVIDGVKCIEELANRVLDEYEYHGRTIREWADLISKIPPHGRLNVIEPYMQHDEDDGFDELIKPSDIDYMHTPSVEEIIKGDGE